METPEDQDPVWKLLEHGRTVEPGPFFARNVVREARKLGDPSGSVWTSFLSLFSRPVVASGALALVAIVAAVLVGLSGSTEAPVEIAQEAVYDPDPTLVITDDSSVDPASELEAVEYLGQLMAVADPGQLSDEALRDLFF